MRKKMTPVGLLVIVVGVFATILTPIYQNYLSGAMGESDFVTVSLDETISVDVPAYWNKPASIILPKSAQEDPILVDKFETGDVRILLSPNNQAKLILHVSYERAVKNSVLNNATKEFLREYVSRRKNLSEIYVTEQNRKILEWPVSANIRVINGYSTIYYTFLTTNPSGTGDLKTELFSYHFDDRLLNIGIVYNSREKNMFVPVLDRVLNSIARSEGNSNV